MEDSELAIFPNDPFFQTQLITQMRGLHKKFDNDLYCGDGLIHDGSEKREDNDHPIETFVAEFFAGLVQVQHQLIAFLDAFPTNVAPVVGWQALIDGPLHAALSNEIGTMIAQAAPAPSRNDVVVKMRVAGQMRGFVMISTAGEEPLFRRDDDTLWTLSALAEQASPATPALFTAVPPGSGVRIGIDQDSDGVSDALDPCPQDPDPACGVAGAASGASVGGGARLAGADPRGNQPRPRRP